MSHCYTWAWTQSGLLCQRCAHCGYEYTHWESLSDRDDERVRESQDNHRKRCPGTSSCGRRRNWS